MQGVTTSEPVSTEDSLYRVGFPDRWDGNFQTASRPSLPFSQAQRQPWALATRRSKMLLSTAFRLFVLVCVPRPKHLPGAWMKSIACWTFPMAPDGRLKEGPQVLSSGLPLGVKSKEEIVRRSPSFFFPESYRSCSWMDGKMHLAFSFLPCCSTSRLVPVSFAAMFVRSLL